MKRLSTILLVSAALLALMQPSSAQLIGVGVKGGVNYSTLSGSFMIDEEDFEVSDLKYKTGLVVGASYSMGLLPMISLQPELLYTSKGAKFSDSFIDDGVPVDIEATLDLTYIEIPILVKVTLPTPGLSPSFYAGPAIAFISAAKAKFEVSAMGFSFSDEQDIKEEIKSTDIGLVLGAGLEFGLPVFKLTADLRYTMGLSSIDEVGDGDIKNNAITLMLGVVF